MYLHINSILSITLQNKNKLLIWWYKQRAVIERDNYYTHSVILSILVVLVSILISIIYSIKWIPDAWDDIFSTMPFMYWCQLHIQTAYPSIANALMNTEAWTVRLFHLVDKVLQPDSRNFMFSWPCIISYQYSKTNEIHFLYSIYYELTTSTCF
jgi:hypothetical protein